MQEVIKSEQNNRVKYLKKLYHKRRRKQEGKYILEGYRIIEEAYASGVNFDSLFMTPNYVSSEQGKKLLEKIDQPSLLTLIEDSLLKRLADTETPQGVIAVVNQTDSNLESLFNEAGLIVVLDRVQDPGNMGTIIRTAVAAGVDGIIALKGCVDIYNLKVLRSTMGAIFNIPVVTDLELNLLMKAVDKKAGKIKVVSAEPSGGVDYHQADLKKPLMLVIGNEANGIRDEILKESDLKVKIPIVGQIESLNAAVACGIILYKIVEKNNIK